MTSSTSPRLPLRARPHLTSVPASYTDPISSPAYYRTLPPLQLPPSKDLYIEQSRSPSATATANSEASVTPEPSKRPLSPTPTPSTTSARLPSVLERPRSPPAGTSPATTIPPPLTTTSTSPATATTITTATTIGLKRPRSPSLIGNSNLNATTHPFFATAQEPPRKMSRFAGPTTDAWQGQHPHHPAMQDRVVLPPLSTAVDNGLTPSRRTSMVSSPTSYTTATQGGSYTFANSFESQRPQPGTGTMSSPSLSTVNGEHGAHPYRRPSMAGRSQTTMMSSRTPASPMSQDIHQPPRLTSAYSDPNTTTTASMSWNIPPPATNSSDRPTTAAYSAYGDYSTTGAFDASTGLAGEGTPQSPSYAFTSNSFAAAAANQPGMYGLSNTTARAAAHHAHHPSYSLAAQLSSQSTPSSNSSSTLISAEQSQNHTPTPIEEELAQLRTKVRELEFVNDLVQLRVVELENEKVKLLGGSDKASSIVGSPSSRSTSSTMVLSGETDPDFQSSWQKRTDARIKRFCSLNRAGNALCAWHDSR
ncbi:hypothetical protein FRB90_008350, partial [Tulasnella sp. 427]